MADVVILCEKARDETSISAAPAATKIFAHLRYIDPPEWMGGRVSNELVDGKRNSIMELNADWRKGKIELRGDFNRPCNSNEESTKTQVVHDEEIVNKQKMKR
jgi:hypothetical protein